MARRHDCWCWSRRRCSRSRASLAAQACSLPENSARQAMCPLAQNAVHLTTHQDRRQAPPPTCSRQRWRCGESNRQQTRDHAMTSSCQDQCTLRKQKKLERQPLSTRPSHTKAGQEVAGGAGWRSSMSTSVSVKTSAVPQSSPRCPATRSSTSCRTRRCSGNAPAADACDLPHCPSWACCSGCPADCPCPRCLLLVFCLLWRVLTELDRLARASCVQ